MLTYSNSTTKRLEAFARARGIDCGILKSPGNSAGVFFVARLGDRVLSRWISLGWTVAEAKEAIECLATRGEASVTPSQTGYSYSV